MRAQQAIVVAALIGVPATAFGQGRVTPPPAPGDPPVRAVPGARYAAGSFHRFLLGSRWRELWASPLTLPVLDIATFEGGLTPEEQGGGLQSITLHMRDPRGREWVFRSLDKYPGEKMGEAIDGTPAGRAMQDLVSMLHPAGQLVIPPMLDGLGILYAKSTLYVMGDSPKLGEFRETFAGLVGGLELKPNEDGEDQPGFAGSRKIVDTEDIIEELRESPFHRVEESELLRARLFDFIIGDPDRGTDQWRWARFPDGDRRFVWRPLPHDRDWAFIAADGIVPAIVRMIYPKLAIYDPDDIPVSALTFTPYQIDRHLLTRLDHADFRTAVERVRRELSDAVIDAGVAQLPPSYPAAHRDWLAAAIRQRRDSLATAGELFYASLAGKIDVAGTDSTDYAEIVRAADGSVTVTLACPAPALATDDGNTAPGPVASGTVYYRRSFLPAETKEVRVYLYGGDDVAVVRGAGGSIDVRVIGGDGDDVLADSTTSGGTHFYDAEGDNRFLRGGHTHVDTREWIAPAPTEGPRIDSDWAPDWGGGRSWGGTADFAVGAGVIVGFGPTWMARGFRRLPYHWKVDAHVLFGAAALRPGAEILGDYRLENSPNSITAAARFSAFDAFRWFGAGNETERIDPLLSLVNVDRFTLSSAYVLRTRRFGAPDTTDETEEAVENEDAHPMKRLHASLSIGPVLEHTSTSAEEASPFATARPIGFSPMWRAGGQATVDVRRTDGRGAPRRGFHFRAAGSAFPALLDAPGTSGTAEAELDGYVPLIGDGLHLALRAGGRTALGDSPAFDAARLGGQRTLRGFDSNRFSGDAAAFGGAELRTPLGKVSLLVRGELGIFALADAGRVWVDGESRGGWHTAYGAGLWFDAFDHAATVTFASGEVRKLYLALGLPF